MEVLVRPGIGGAVALALAAAACSPNRCGVALCDLREAACQERLAAAAGCFREVAAPRVPVRVISEADYLAEVTADTRAYFDPVVFRRMVAGLALFDLAPANLTVDDAAQVSAWAAGYYSSSKDGIVIIDRGAPMDSLWQVSLLVHEYTHAIQDLRGGVFPRRSRSTDHNLAQRAASEGEADLVQDLAELALFQEAAEDVPWSQVYGNWQARARISMRRSPAPFLVADLHFVYPFGAQLVHTAWTQGGWPAVEGLVAAPPASSRQVERGYGAAEPAGGPWFESLDAEALPVLPPGLELVVHDEMGAWVLESYLHRLGVEEGEALARHLRGDHLSIHEEPATGTTVAVWRLRFDSADTAARVQAAVGPRLRGFKRAWVRDRDVVVAATNHGPSLSQLGPGLMFRAVPPPPMPEPGMSPGRAGCPARTLAR